MLAEKNDRAGVSEYLVRIDILAIWRWLTQKFKSRLN
jgi:hypothetical protein